MEVKTGSRKLSHLVYDKIRKTMLEKQMSAGDKLPTEQELCELYGVSRNVVREAIKALEITGAVKSSPGIGIVVQEFNLEFMFEQLFYFLASDSRFLMGELQDIRRVLELGYAEETYQRMTDKTVAELREILEVMEFKCFKKQYFVQEDMRFHVKMAEPLNNRTLAAILHAYWDVDAVFSLPMKLEYLESSYADHAAIVDALEKKDFPLFYKALENHFVLKKSYWE